MKIDSIIYSPLAVCVFSRADMELLIRCSESHYDWTCRSLSLPGGQLYGLRNRFAEDDTHAEMRVNIPEVDLLCKVAESPLCDPELQWQLMTTFKALNDKYEELNSRWIIRFQPARQVIGDQTPLYWTGSCWTDKKYDAKTFTLAERTSTPLPQGGQWEEQ